MTFWHCVNLRMISTYSEYKIAWSASEKRSEKTAGKSDCATSPGTPGMIILWKSSRIEKQVTF